MRKPWLAPLLATTLSLAAAGPASAGHGWQTGSLVTPPYNQVTALHADVDLVGNTLAVWRDDKSGSLLYRERPYAGTFADAPAVITQAAVHDEVLAGDRHGNAVVAYWADGAIWASFKATGQPFAAPQRVASSPGEARIVASFGANGDAVVAWTEIDGTASVVRASVRRAAQPAFDAPVQLGTGAMVDASAQDDAGNGLVVWTQADGMRIARHPAGGGFLPPQTIAVDGPVVELKLAVGLDGRALLGYSEAPGGGVDAAHVAVATGTTTAGLGE
ncbi:MAG: hypothetical protein QOJ07_1179, partial [Thermoleophilaceae bacterium]|nr:hypothetical protein [Thermoleophilaceae bacterium]